MVGRLVHADVREDEDPEDAGGAPVDAVSEVVRSQARAYGIESVRGRGGFGITYVATRADTGERVLLKELSLARAESWKSVELFEREAAVLARLDHVGIPRFIESFVVDANGGPRMFLAQELIAGPTLAERVRQRGPLTPSEATTMLVALADVLALLHGQDPPIVHRDVNPSNIVLGTDGRAHLVDFGAVQERAPRADGGSTMVGTAGYVPMEQLMGQARPASDLYALGMSTVFALTGKDPATLPLDEADGGARIDDVLAGVPDALRSTLARMIAPAMGKRLADARSVRTSLARRARATPMILLGVLTAAVVLGASLFVAARSAPPIPVAVAAAETAPPETAPSPLPSTEPPYRQVHAMPHREADVQHAVEELTPQLRRECWDGRPSNAAEATVSLDVSVDRSGNVTRVVASGSDDALAACVAQRIGKMRLSEGDSATKIVIPFRFVRANASPSGSSAPLRGAR